VESLTIPTPAGRTHVVVDGDGPLVLFVHGFPESWYSWRFQLPAVAAAGFRAAALDVRGYGRSSRPSAVESYRMVELVDDVAAVIDALSNGPAVVVGHDWGSPITANAALLRPDLLRAIALMSVPYVPRGGPRPTSFYAQVGGEDTFYIDYFQQPGRAEAEIEPDVAGWITGMYASLSADTMTHERSRNAFFVPPGGRMRDRFVTGRPAWLDRETEAFFVGEFERTGLTGGLNRYRNVDRDWSDLEAYDGAALTLPSLFVGGTDDPVVRGGRDFIEAFGQTMPGLRGVHLLDGVGHWVQQEAPDAVTDLLLSWLRGL
jgi:pimeloyl-ACP methyl ester carboxylesterase